MRTNELINIMKKHKENRFILGIDGLSRSGKTTFVTNLKENMKQESIPFHIFHIDDHIVERNKRYDTGFEEWHEYYYLQWDIEWLRQKFFQKLQTETKLNLPFYNDVTDACEMKKVQIPIVGVIVIEGVFLQRKEWRDFFHYMVYLDCPRETRFLRESEETQKKLSKFQNRYWKAEDYYLETELPKEQADLIIQ
ncbi:MULTISPECIES: kinase [Bacillus]|uniref:Uridine kinase n=1 Tax=Bacillus thuringiensis serovar sooncheon TaxID=180891 RepID=A0A9Q5SNR0_BACTU|nr:MULTISPECIES: kinase [Bacillus]MDC7974927.1 kinase [Bacillus sp. BLCC-B18]OTW71884.1 uridine kinase [Bacillus thuringiensis serovar coreanensis]OTX55504.1 uridine kinase [Bacillus thuringiensis serovar sooncheon]OTX58841.1 uridine kinase [Bacillus thuringiensis serovar guiyangiensis]OTX72527.1 uridine kinase [Bacillus thuringiensis serovar roskildiensis]